MTEACACYHLAVVPFNPAPPVIDFPVLAGGVAAFLVFATFLGVLAFRTDATPWGRLVSTVRIVFLGILLQSVAWLASVSLFTLVSFCFYSAADFQFLLPPFFFTLIVFQAWAWWVVGGKGVSSLAPLIHAQGVGLRSVPLVVWTIAGAAWSLCHNAAFFALSNKGQAFLELWTAPYV